MAFLFFVVDDDPNGRKLVVDRLEIICTDVPTFLEASDGDQALELYRSLQAYPDVVITDCNMPNMDGDVFIRKIKEINPAQLVIATTGLIVENKARLEAAGASVVIPKPFRLDVLEGAIKKVLNLQRV
jgi:two-component system, NarL family, capsular synthesis sensor histidine kinase RcsC